MANGNFGGGDGTAFNPYLVEDAHDLDAVRNYLGNSSVHFKQVANIDLSSWGNWLPIQNGTSTSGSNVFRGTYDGGGYKISNMRCQHNRNHVGLFGYTDSATIKNIFVENCNVSGIDYVGGLASYTSSNSSIVSNCYSSGNVIGVSWVGGLVGYAFSGAISNCYSSGNVSGDSRIGGLIGGSGAKISNCYSSVNVSGNDYWIGGLIGSSSSTVSNCYSSGSVSGYNSVGGLVGMTSSAKVSNSYALNPFIARVPSSTSTNFGDIAGSYDSGDIKNCFSLDTLEFRQL